MEPQLDVPGGNGHPIAIAAELVPDKSEPVQASIPGLKPAFDVASALDLIEEAEATASTAETAHSLAVVVAKSKRQAADEANAHLRELIRDLNSRRHETQYEAPSAGPSVSVEDEAEATRSAVGRVRLPAGDGAASENLTGSQENQVAPDPHRSPEVPAEPPTMPQDARLDAEPPSPSSPSRRRPRSRRRAQ